MTADDVVLLQRVAGNRAVAQLLQRRNRESRASGSSSAMIQRQKNPGRYETTKPANLRADGTPYSVLCQIPKGEEVQVQPKGGRTSNFKAGRKTNEHSWSGWQSPNGLRTGWIEDSKLKLAPPLPAPIRTAPVPAAAPPKSTSVPSAPPQPRRTAAIEIGGGKQPAPAQPRPTTAAIGIGGGTGKARQDKWKGSESFQEGLTYQGLGDLDDMALQENVRATEVTPLDKSKVKVIIGNGQLYTHDGQFLLDSKGHEVRYVLCRSGGDQVALYASQVFRRPHGVPFDAAAAIVTYPTLTSHAQVTGTVVGAGDFVISQGRITKVSNKSGTWHPRGGNLATTLRAMVGWGALDAARVRRGSIEVQQFLPGTDAVDVDKGELVTLKHEHLQNL